MKSLSLCALVVLQAVLAVAAGGQPNCRNRIRKYALEHCSGFREKRSLVDGELRPREDLESTVKVHRIGKRQAMTMSEIIMTSGVPEYNYYHYPQVPRFLGTFYVPIVPAMHTDDYEMQPKRDALPKEKNSNLGFERDQELEELFEELSDRLPRSPNQGPNEVHEDFMKYAWACCSNDDMCQSTIGSLLNC